MYGIITFLYDALDSTLPVMYLIPITIIATTEITVPITCIVPKTLFTFVVSSAGVSIFKLFTTLSGSIIPVPAAYEVSAIQFIVSNIKFISKTVIFYFFI